MKHILTSVIFFWSLQSSAVIYDTNEIDRELSQSSLQQLTQNYLSRYFTSKQPDSVIEQLINADMTPLHKEYILHQLLVEISQQPPQAYFQSFVNLMKKYDVQASQEALEGTIPVAIFNLKGKAHGIENIWTAYRTEQKFNQFFSKGTAEAVDAIKGVIAERSRPKWLGVKNSMAALNSQQLADLENHLLSAIKINTGYDQLLSHVALMTGNQQLINKALMSEQVTVREFTLRHLASALPHDGAKSTLMEQTKNGRDSKFSLSLLQQFSNDEQVKLFMMEQLQNPALAESAAFALSQSADLSLPEQLKRQYLQSKSQVEQNHILLSLKLNKTSAAKLAIEDLRSHIGSHSTQEKWLKSFDGAAQ
jgi:hypothetical protein